MNASKRIADSGWRMTLARAQTQRGLAFTPESAYRAPRTLHSSAHFAPTYRRRSEVVRDAVLYVGAATLCIALLAGSLA